MTPPGTAAPPRPDLDDDAVAAELEAEKGSDDDGLGPAGGGEPPVDPEGGAEPPAAEPEPGTEPPLGDGGSSEPPTPPADLPGGGDDEDAEEGEQLYLMGNKELGLKVGGRKPDSSVLKFKGGKLDLVGQFDREDRFTTVDVWQITGDNDQDTIDKLSGAVKSTSKAQSATLCGTKRVEEWIQDRLEGHFSAEEIAAVFSALELEQPTEA